MEFAKDGSEESGWRRVCVGGEEGNQGGVASLGDGAMDEGSGAGAGEAVDE